MNDTFFSKVENLLDVRNVFSVNRTTEALKHGINQITVALEFFHEVLRYVITAKTVKAPKYFKAIR